MPFGSFADTCTLKAPPVAKVGLIKLLLLVLVLSTESRAQFLYTTNNGTITITGYDCSSSSGALNIPSIINGLPVSAIGEYAFADCTNVHALTFPDTITSLGVGAFYGCTSLTDAVIGKSVTNIGDSAFYRCTGMTALVRGVSARARSATPCR